MEIYKKFFGEKLRKAIDAAESNQSKLAEILGVKTSTVSRWVNGHDFPNDERLPDICEALSIDLSYFLQMNPAPEPPTAKTLLAALNEAHEEKDKISQKYEHLKGILKQLNPEWIARLVAKKPDDWAAVTARVLLDEDISLLREIRLPDHLRQGLEKKLAKNE